MSYDSVTPEHFKVAKPQFVSVHDPVIQWYLHASELFVDQSWPENIYRTAVVAVACHLATLDGEGTDAQSQSFAADSVAFQSIKSGELTLTRYAKAAGGMSFAEWLEQTRCGAFYAQLLRMVKGGPRIAMGGMGHQTSPYAKDVPMAWPTFFDGWR